MKIVLISEFFYPYKTSTQKILTELSEDLVESGLEVDVITTKNAYREEKIKLKRYEEYKGIKINRIFSIDGNRDSKLFRLLGYIIFTVGVFKNLLFKKDYDKILFVSNPPLVPFIGYVMKKIKRKPYVYLVHDVYPDVAITLNVIKETSIISKLMNFINKKIYLNAEKVIVLGKDMKELIMTKNIPEEKVKIITNWADSNVNYPKVVDEEFVTKHKLKNKFNVMYTGNISKVHDIDTILDVVRILKNNKEILFTFIGGGNQREYIEKIKKEEKLDNIQIKDYMFGEEYNNILNCADLFITTLQQGMRGLGVPSKTYTYMSIHKPLIAIMESNTEIGHMINENKLGKCFDSGKSIDISNFIILLKNNDWLYNEYSSNVKRVFNDNYERKVVTKNFYKELIY